MRWLFFFLFIGSGIAYGQEVGENFVMPSQGFTWGGLLRGTLGIAFLVAVGWLFSSKRSKINWLTVILGLGIQLLLAILILKGQSFGMGFIGDFFNTVGKFFTNVLAYTQEGTRFLLGDFLDTNIDNFGFIFLFQALPILVFFSALTSVLFYLGVIQVVVKVLAKALTKVLGISGPEALSLAGNIFLGQTESPLMIKQYLSNMNRSEILLVMIGGMATVAGSVLGAYIGFLGKGDPELMNYYAKHLLAASVMAAPGAIVISKLLLPQTEDILKETSVKIENAGSNFLDAMANGTTEGLKLAANVGAMLLVFIAFIALINGVLGGVGDFGGINSWIQANTTYNQLSIEFILGYTFAPIMWLIGVPDADLSLMGQLLGVKIVASEFVAYGQLANLKDISNPQFLSHQKSVVMATYMLCGFANFASIGIQIGGIGMLAPNRRKWLSQFGLKALLGGTIASLISATMAGMLVG